MNQCILFCDLMDGNDKMTVTLRPHRLKLYLKNFLNVFQHVKLSLTAHSQTHMRRAAKSDVLSTTVTKLRLLV